MCVNEKYTKSFVKKSIVNSYHSKERERSPFDKCENQYLNNNNNSSNQQTIVSPITIERKDENLFCQKNQKIKKSDINNVKLT